MSNPIPDTNDFRIAALAAALHLVDATMPVVEEQDRLEDKLQRFLDAFDVIYSAWDKGVFEAQDRLDAIKKRPAR